ncbi:MAG: response regulator transcription factor [Actinomycetota bacterium]|nr:response regulator transcription factor [Actinomycetota bacterium]
MEKIKLFLVEDHDIYLLGLRMILEKERDFEITQVAGNLAEAIRVAENSPCHVLLWSLDATELSDFELIKRFKKVNPNTKVVVLSTLEDDSIFNELIKTGIDGYLLKSAPSMELIKAIISVVQEKSSINPFPVPKSVEMIEDHPIYNKFHFTPKELEVLKYLLQGYSNREIAQKLFISPSTVKFHLRKIYRKTGTENRFKLFTQFNSILGKVNK